MDLPNPAMNQTSPHPMNSSPDSLVTGIFFLLLSFGWYLQSVKTFSLSSSSPSFISSMSTYLPLHGLYLVTLTSTSILATVMLDTDKEHILSMVTIYVAFSIPGLLNIIIFYTRRDLLPRHSQSFCLGIAFLVEYLTVSAGKEEVISEPFSSCLLMAILGCLISSVLMISSSSMTTFSLIMLSMIQGTWLMHSAYLTCSEKMSYLYFSWHVLAVFCITLVINVIMQLQAGTQVKKHMAAKHSNLATTVDKISDVYSEANTGLTVVTNSEEASEENYKEVADKINVYENYKVEQKLKEELEINNVLYTIDKMVEEQASKETDNRSLNIDIDLSDQNDKITNNTCERLSPLEEFNTLHRHVSGVRASIKLKESDIV